MNVELLLDKLKRVRKNGQGRWMACCPAHPDKAPSLSIRETPDGSILLYCFSGCPAAEIVKAVGLSLADLMPEGKDDYRDGRYELVGVPKFHWKEAMNKLLHNIEVVDISTGLILRDGKLPKEEASTFATALRELRILANLFKTNQ